MHKENEEEDVVLKKECKCAIEIKEKLAFLTQQKQWV